MESSANLYTSRVDGIMREAQIGRVALGMVVPLPGMTKNGVIIGVIPRATWIDTSSRRCFLTLTPTKDAAEEEITKFQSTYKLSEGALEGILLFTDDGKMI